MRTLRIKRQQLLAFVHIYEWRFNAVLFLWEGLLLADEHIMNNYGTDFFPSFQALHIIHDGTFFPALIYFVFLYVEILKMLNSEILFEQECKVKSV